MKPNLVHPQYDSLVEWECVEYEHQDENSKQGGMSPLILKQERIFTTLMVVEPPTGCESDWDNGKEQPHPTPYLIFVFVSRLQNFNQQNFPTQHKLFLSDPSPIIGYACQ